MKKGKEQADPSRSDLSDSLNNFSRVAFLSALSENT